MKCILLVGNFLSRTKGSKGVCEELAEHLKQAGWEVITASSKPSRLFRLLDMIYVVWRHRQSYKAVQVDVFSGPSFFWAEVVCWLLRRIGKPYVLTLHGGNLPVFARQWPGRVGRLLRSADIVTSPSQYLIERMRLYRPDIRLIRNALLLENYPFFERKSCTPSLVWLRAFNKTYNPQMAVYVLALLIQQFPDIHLIMIGPDKKDGTFCLTKTLARRLAVYDRILFTGGIHKESVPYYLKKGDIFLNTTFVDNFPVSVIEAAAIGLPIVTTNAGEGAYFWRNGKDALVVSPDDPKAMAEAVRRILTEPELARTLSVNARQKAESLDWAKILLFWEKIFQELITKTERRPT